MNSSSMDLEQSESGAVGTSSLFDQVVAPLATGSANPLAGRRGKETFGFNAVVHSDSDE